ncbi:MAG TPA: histidine phosphatase family protein [Ktedonobacteraceae bacterium]|jgi:probable phosphoglycerate mutase
MTLQISALHNRYIALRHGKSAANERGIIVSDPEEGLETCGLTTQGQTQVTLAVREAQSKGIIDGQTMIYTSDFKRCRETSAIARMILQCPGVHLTTALRERGFGIWERTSHCNYQHVWDLDAQDPDHESAGVESASAVRRRVLALIAELEGLYRQATILLVSHGDVLQILQTAFSELPAACHRQFPPLAPAEMRELIPAGPDHST